MAAPVLSSYSTVAASPILIIKHSFTTGATATAFSHYGPATAPDLVWVNNSSTNPTGANVAVYSLTSTQFTLDCEDDGNDTVDVYLGWVDASAGGIS